MKTRYFAISFIICLFTSGLFAQRTTRVNAIKANNYGVVYSLPKTSFEITLLVKKTTYQRGDFYQFAQRYLGIENPVTENRTVFQLEDILVVNKGIPDKQNSFMVEFRSNTLQPYVMLREDGVIASINSEPETVNVAEMEIPASQSASVNPRRFLSQETLMAGSTAKQAELVSRQIFDLRRSRNDILIGEAETMPPDGNAYKVVMDEINMQEKALTELFAGSESIEYFTHTFTIVPETGNIDRRIVARFSEKLGPVDADNLAGEPVYFTLKNKTPQVELQLSERDLQRLENKLSEGLVYNIPGKADLSIEFKNQTIKNMEVDVVQYGSQDVLTRRMFDNMKQPIEVIFYPELGAVKQIIQ